MRLFLRVKDGGRLRSWLFIYQSIGVDGGDGGRAGRRRELGLGGYPSVSLKRARQGACAARDLLASGVDPIAERRRERDRVRDAASASVASVAVAVEPVTFGMVASVCLVGEIEPVVTSKVVVRYRGYIAGALSGFGALPVADIGLGDVVAALRPVWGRPTGKRTRSFIERVLDYAMVKGLRGEGPGSDVNPARLRGRLEHVLPDVAWVERHHQALPWSEVPALMTRLTAMTGSEPAVYGNGPAALRFAILCGLRQLEVGRCAGLMCGATGSSFQLIVTRPGASIACHCRRQPRGSLTTCAHRRCKGPCSPASKR